MIHFYKKEKSGCMLALEFFEKLKGSPLFSEETKQAKLLTVYFHSYIISKN